MRSETATRCRRPGAAAIESTTDERFRRSNAVSWAWLDLNLRPHPYQVSRAKRCADRRFPRSLATVRGEGMRSYWPLHATRQVHDDDQLAGYTWILLAGVLDRNVASNTLLVPSLDGRVSSGGVP